MKFQKKGRAYLLIGIIMCAGTGIGFGIYFLFFNDSLDEPTHPQVQMNIEGVGTLVIKFFPDYAPNTVDNFLTLTEDDFYDGLTFHRVISDFVAQGGCPYGTGYGGPGYTINDEIEGNALTHVYGAMAMANAGPNTAGSQFYFVLNQTNCEHLDNSYTVFGQVIVGLDLLLEIEEGDIMTEVFII